MFITKVLSLSNALSRLRKKKKVFPYPNLVHLQKSPIKSDESYKIPVKTDSNNEIYECVTHFCDLSL